MEQQEAAEKAKQHVQRAAAAAQEAEERQAAKEREAAAYAADLDEWFHEEQQAAARTKCHVHCASLQADSPTPLTNQPGITAGHMIAYEDDEASPCSSIDLTTALPFIDSLDADCDHPPAGQPRTEGNKSIDESSQPI